MTEAQHRGIVAGFLHVLHSSPEVLKEWMDTPKHDADSIGKLVQRSMGLSQAPSHDDLTKMAAYADEHLGPQIDEIKKKAPGVPHTVGFVFTTQQ